MPPRLTREMPLDHYTALASTARSCRYSVISAGNAGKTVPNGMEWAKPPGGVAARMKNEDDE